MQQEQADNKQSKRPTIKELRETIELYEEQQKDYQECIDLYEKRVALLEERLKEADELIGLYRDNREFRIRIIDTQMAAIRILIHRNLWQRIINYIPDVITKILEIDEQDK